MLADEAAVEAATIEVECARGPILLTSGGDDRAWPSRLLCDIAVRRMAAHGRADDIEHLTYPRAGHFPLLPGDGYSDTFGWPDSSYRFLLGGSAEEDGAASRDAWPRILESLQTLR